MNHTLTFDTLQPILDALEGVKQNGNGWTARCPAHDDKNPSLSLTTGDDGRILLRCFAGCTPEAVVSALGLTMRDLFAPDDWQPPRRTTQAPKPQSPRTFATLAEAVAALSMGAPVKVWMYQDDNGEAVGATARWDDANGKTIRPFRALASGWVIGAMPAPRPLYQLTELAKAEIVWLVEGEKCADALAQLGLTVTTWAGGANAWRQADWSALAGKQVFLIPDNDDPGWAAMNGIAQALLKLGARCQIITLPVERDGGDVADLLAEGGSWECYTEEDIRSALMALADAAPFVASESTKAKTTRKLEPFRPFPVDLLPDTVRPFVTETADALGCDPTFVALPTLAVLGSAIGTNRLIEPKDSWREPPIIWAVIVAPSGSLKSPAMDAALEPLRAAQLERIAEYEKAKISFELEWMVYERDQADFKKHKLDEPPVKPEPPTCTRYVVADATIESLVPILQANPRGLLLARDELSGWLRGFNQYKGGQGGDVAAWLELHRAAPLIVDRKTGVIKTALVKRAACSITGTVQPGVLASCLTSDHFESGLAARLLLAAPPVKKKRWSERTPSKSAVTDYTQTIGRLLRLLYEDTEHGPKPIILTLSDDAKGEWCEWYDQHADRQHLASDDRERAALAKLEAYAARFALIFALCDDPNAREVASASVCRGCELAEWFAGECERVYGLMGETAEGREQKKLIEWIKGRGGIATPRDLVRNLSRFNGKTAAAEDALNDLAQAGWGEWEHVPSGPKGGPPSKRLRLTDATDTDTTPTNRGVS